jgi:phage baseplate assembly protein gpV
MNIFDAIRELQEQVAEAHAEIARLKTDHDHTVIHGPATDIDAKKQLCRIQIGVDDDGNPVKSPWRPYGQIAGKRKIHSATSKGQQLTLISPCGDIAQGIALPFTWSNDNPSPSEDAETDVDQRGKTRLTQTDGTWKQEVENASVSLTKDNIACAADETIASAAKKKIIHTAGDQNKSSVTLEDGKLTIKSNKIDLNPSS